MRMIRQLQTTIISPMPRALQEGQQLDAFSRWAFYLFMASLPFKMPLPEEFIGFVSPSRIFAVLLIIAFLISPALRPWKIPITFWLFAGFFVAVIIGTMSAGSVDIATLYHTLEYVQFMLLFILSYNFFLNGTATRGGLVAYVLSSLTVAGMILSGYSTVLETFKEQRISAFGEDVNVFATWFIAGFLMCFGLSYSRKGPKPWPWFVSWIFAIPLLYVVINTGSRGGLVSLLIGILTFMAAFGSVGKKAFNVILVACLLGGVGYALVKNETLLVRTQRTIDTGDMARREKIWTAAWMMVKERPIFGWGIAESHKELAVVLHDPKQVRSEHSLLFRVLLFGGFAGGILFFSGLAACIWRAYLARTGVEGILPLALLLSATAAHMALGGLADKNFWVIMAYSLAAGTNANSRNMPAQQRAGEKPLLQPRRSG